MCTTSKLTGAEKQAQIEGARAFAGRPPIPRPDDHFWLVNTPEEELREYLTLAAGYDRKTCTRQIKLLRGLRECLVIAAGGQNQVGRLEQLLGEYAQMPLPPNPNEIRLLHLLHIDLIFRAAQATMSNTFVCEHCGKVGRAHQKNKRFCNTTCRVNAFRERRLAL